MKYVFLFKPDAERDLRDAWRWYEECREGLGDEFISALDEALSRIDRNASGYPIIDRETTTRQMLLKRFPYSILYRLDKVQITVFAVFHHHRDPEVWKSRM